ncbi:hypothetical protein ROE7235_03000 [Roseibaca ekhonensis]|uniref:Uncharacterized protein n=1 Tax=Roseinatronobacter ekhonensis TaxID=254356 RepID=A0A3B0MBJ3_9RHOB|nr:hypothetical protein ROE7235_03000 [Roseibaca ekhonensis]
MSVVPVLLPLEASAQIVRVCCMTEVDGRRTDSHCDVGRSR